MAIYSLPNPAKSADRVLDNKERSESLVCSAALPRLVGEELLNTIVWDQAALDKFRRYFLPKDTLGPPTYEADEDVVLGEIRRLAQHEPLTFTTRPPSWVRRDAKAIGYATLGDWCAFAIGLRSRGRVDREPQASGSYKPYAVISTIAPIGHGHDWQRIDVNSLSGRVLAYAVLLTRDAAPSYARAAGMRKTASLNRVRAHFFRAIAANGRMVRETPARAAAGERAAAGFLVLNHRRIFPVHRRDSNTAHLKRPHPFYAGECLTRQR
jgi:hypothetical protein